MFFLPDCLNENWLTYTLTATLGDRTDTAKVDVPLHPFFEPNHIFPGSPDGEAMMSAGFGTIPSLAYQGGDYRHKALWANGHIVLTDPFGRVVAEMEMKS